MVGMGCAAAYAMGAAATGTAVGKGVRPPQFDRAALRRKGLPPGAAAFQVDGGREILPGLGGLALGTVQAAGGRQHLGIIGGQLQRDLDGRFRIGEIFGGRGRRGGRQQQLEVARVLLQQAMVELHGLGVVAVVGVHAGQHADHVGIVRTLGQQRGQGVVGGGEVAGLAQRVGLAQDVAHADVLVAAPLLRGHGRVLQLAQDAGQFHVLVRLEQRRGVLQAQPGVGAGRARQHLAHHGQRAVGVARVGIGQGHGAQQLRILAHEGLGLGQHGLGLLHAAFAAQRGGGVGLHMHPDALLQRGDVARAVLFGNALQRGQRAGPVARLGGEQRARVQRLGHVRVGHQQPVHHAARLVDGTHLQVQARQVQPHPGVAGVVEQRVFQGDARGIVVAALGGGARQAQGLRGAQSAQGAHLFLLAGRELLDQLQRLGRLAGLRQHAHQAADRIGVVGLAREHAAVGGLGGFELAQLGQHVGQVVLGGDFAGVQAHGLVQQLACVAQVARLARGAGLLDQCPVGGAVQRLLPARGRALASGALQVAARLGELFLAQAQHAHAAERVAVVGAGFEHAAEFGLGGFEVAVLQRLEALGAALAQRVARGGGTGARGALARLDLAQAGLHGLVARIGAQEGLVERNVGRAAARPGQGLAPAVGGGLAHFGVAGQAGELGDALAPRGFAVGKVLGQGQGDLGVVGRFARQALQAAAGLVPAAGGAAQRLVVLQCQRAGGRLVAQRGLVAAHGLLGLAGTGQVARMLHLRAVALHADLLLQPLHQAVAGVGAAQLLQVALGLLHVLALQLRAGHAVEGVGLVRVHAQELLPALDGALGVAARLPVLALLDQRLGGGVLGLGRSGQAAERGDEAQDQGVLVVALLCGHAFSQRNCSLPEGRNW
jgi:hypothetical protein